MNKWYGSKVMSHLSTPRILALNSSLTKVLKLGFRKLLHNGFAAETFIKSSYLTYI